MHPKHQILLDLLKDQYAAADPANPSPANPAPETWTQILSEADRHRIAPLLYAKIKHNRAESRFPADVLKQLQKKYLATAYTNTGLFHRLDELLTRLNNKNIPVIILKGAHLAEFVYKDIAARPMSDIDIMVKEEHLHEAVQIAFEAGYRFFNNKNGSQEKSIENYYYQILSDAKHFKALIHPETKCLLEIHCYISAIDSPFQIEVSDLLGRSRANLLNGQPVYLLSPEDLTLYLCLHAAYDHLFEFGLSMLYDIAITINHYEQSIDWRKVINRSRKWRASQCLKLSLYFTKKFFLVNIPDEVFENFQIDPIANTAEERIFKTNELLPLHQYYHKWINSKGAREKAILIKNVLFPSRDFVVSRYVKPKDSGFVFSSYLLRFSQAAKAVFLICKASLFDGRYQSRIKRGNTDLQLREWLVKL